MNDLSLVYEDDGELYTDSLIIAREFGLKHSHVLRSLDAVFAENTITESEFGISEYKDATGRFLRLIELTEREALIAMPFIGGRTAREGRARIVDAFATKRN